MNARNTVTARKMRPIRTISPTIHSLHDSNTHLTKMKRANRIVERVLFWSPLVIIAIGFAIYGFADWEAALVVMSCMYPLALMNRWMNRSTEKEYERKIIQGRLDGTMR